MSEDDEASRLVGDTRREARRRAAEANPDKIPPEILSMIVLIIDDEKPMRTLLENALQAFEIRNILQAASVHDAMQIMQHQHVDLILIDEEMPGMQGAEFVFRLRRGALPVRKDIPVIMITSHIEQDHIMLSRNAGVDEFLAKPVSASQLYKRIYSSMLHQRPFVVDEDGYRGPERRWLKKEAEDRAKPQVEVIDYNNPKPAQNSEQQILEKKIRTEKKADD